MYCLVDFGVYIEIKSGFGLHLIQNGTSCVSVVVAWRHHRRSHAVVIFGILLDDLHERNTRKNPIRDWRFQGPGADGLHAIFYKRFWPMLGDDLVEEVLHAINTCVIPQGWNDTVIVMIPKINTPEKVTQFRPISLCNVVYKVISKMIASCLKPLLPEIISPTQSTFVPGRLITDNVLIAYESLHAIKNKRKGKEGWCAVKLDMHKAYDRVEWVFLEAILLKLGFHENWVKMVMQCVCSVQYSVRFNSEETECFKPSRGL